MPVSDQEWRWQDRLAEGRTGGRRCGQVSEAERGPGRRGGETALPGAHPWPSSLPAHRASCGRASPPACPGRSAFKGKFLCSQPRASSYREGCRGVFGSAETKPPGWPIVTVPSASRQPSMQGVGQSAGGGPASLLRWADVATAVPAAHLPGTARRARSASRDRCPATLYQLTTPAAFRPRALARPRTAALRPARPRSGARSPSPRASPAASGWTARRSAAAAWASHPR